ncbi:MAG: hypothetical protein LBD23_07750 [Oscillospiraceae bacterium]|jgi:hypothetical protein|nr:hypothetical protein [Oscillospiraceae bacterium]
MKTKKLKALIISLSTLIIIAIVSLIIIFGVNNMHPEKAFNNLLKQIEQGNLEDITLIIYYTPLFTPFPTRDVNDLINDKDTRKIIIDSIQLAEHIDLFRSLNNIEFVRFKSESDMDAKIHYIFEDNRGRRIFNVTLWGWDKNDEDISIVFINGRAFEVNEDIFYNIIEPFIPRTWTE